MIQQDFICLSLILNRQKVSNKFLNTIVDHFDKAEEYLIETSFPSN